MPSLFACPVCEAKISTEADPCVSCGQPSPLQLHLKNAMKKRTRFEGVVKSSSGGVLAAVRFGDFQATGTANFHQTAPPKGTKLTVYISDIESTGTIRLYVVK